MSNDPLAFLTQAEKKSISSDPLSFLSGKSKKEKAARTAAQYGIGAAETALFPYELAVTPLKSKSAQTAEYRKGLFEDIERLSEQKQTGVWDEEDERLLNSLINQVQNPKEAEKFVKTADIGVGGLAEKGAKELGYDLEPEGLGEHGARLLGNIVSPQGLIKGAQKLPKFAKGLVDKEFRHAIKEQKNWSRLASAAKGNPEKETLLKFAQDHKLSPEATNLLFHSKGTAEYLTLVGKKTKRFKKAVSELKNKLGENYEDLKALGKQGGQLDYVETEKLIDSLSNLLSEMKSTHVVGPEAQPVINTIEKSVESIMNRGVDVKELINSRINLSDSINWKNISRGDFYRTEARRIFSDAITEKNPAIGERLLNTDRAWGKYEKFRDVLDKKIPTFSWKGIKLPSSLVETAAFISAPFIPIVGGAATKILIAKQVFQRLATEMAINPKLQAPLKRWQKAMISGSTESQKRAFLVIKHLVKKEDPDLYEELKGLEVH